MRYIFVPIILFLITFQVGAQSIFSNQVGYSPKAIKRAYVSGDMEGKSFKIIDSDTGKKIFKGELSEAKVWPHSGTSACIADFTSLQKPGKYSLIIGHGDATRSIIIDPDVNLELGKAVIKSYYYARASESLSEEYVGIYARLMGHPDNKVKIHSSAASSSRPEGTIISSPGGWYDAGDYNKYIVNSGISTYSLLHLYDLFPEYCDALNLNIPESKNQLPDLLDEILINLRWMLTMQDPNDGGVYHKLTSKNFCGMVMPHKDKLERYVVMKTTSATFDFAAVTAKAARVFSKFEKELPGLSDSCLVAAKDAWKWAQKNPDVLYVQPKDITTGAYGDKNIDDEKYWASNELYLSTGDKKYLRGSVYKKKIDAPEWGHVATLGVYSLLEEKISGKSNLDETDLKSAERKLLKSAEKYYQNYVESAFGISLDTFPWGSNSELANQGILLIHAYLVTGQSKYFDAAEACLHYILGANPLDKCFVTGFGANSPMNIHDRRSTADGIDAPIPGLLAGGPTKQARKDCGEENYTSDYPALSYLDMECSYATNEVAINWNAALALLANAIEAITEKNNPSISNRDKMVKEGRR